MDWQDTLIELYLYLCKHYDRHLHPLAERFSNNHKQPTFTDQEVLTIFLFGLLQKHTTLSTIHDYTKNHLAHWFPELAGYGGYVQRLNRLCDVFPALIEKVLGDYS